MGPDAQKAGAGIRPWQSTGFGQHSPTVRAELLALARDNTQLLINQQWQLPSVREEKAVVARLREPATGLPRGKPLSGHGHLPAGSSSRIIRASIRPRRSPSGGTR